MTHAVPGQEGYHHVNCQLSEYWIKKLQSIGFEYNDNLSKKIKNLTNKMHVKNTLLVFEKITELNVERMEGYGEFLVDNYQVNYLYGLNDICKCFLNKDKTVLELGTNNGVSTKLFSKYAKKVTAVDILLTQKFNSFLSSADNVEFHNISFFTFSKINNEKYDLIYIDGDHSYESIKEDINIFKQFVKPGGIISGHDYNSLTPGVTTAVNEIFGEKNIQIYSDSSWVFKM